MIEKRKVGRIGLEIPVLGFGCGPVGGLYAPVPDEQAIATVRAAWDGGIRYFDVAPLYGSGLAERRLGTALRDETGGFVVSTKVGRLLKPLTNRPVEPHRPSFEIAYDYSYDGVMRSVEDSFQRMGMTRIDVLYIHDVNRRWHGDAVEQRFREVMEGGYRALEKLRGEGVVKAIGAGMNDAAMLARFAEAGDFDCLMLAGRYTLLEQTPLDQLFPVCERKGISVVAAGPFNSGILATGATAGAKYFYKDAPDDVLQTTHAIEAVCARHGVALPAAALQFALGHPVVVSVVTGMVAPEEVRANLEHMVRPIPGDFWQELKSEGLIREDAPSPAGYVS